MLVKNSFIRLGGLLAILFTATILTMAQDEERIAVGTNLVSVTVAATDSHGRTVEGLTRSNFQLFDNDVRQQIAHFSNDRSPFSIGIIYDMHGPSSVREDEILRALKRFAATLRNDEDLFFLGFNERGSLAIDFVPTAAQVSAHLSNPNKNSPTSLYDAVYQAMERVRAGRHAKKVLLVVSDGDDHNSRTSYRELRRRLGEVDLQVYTIAIADPEHDPLAGNGRWVFEEISGQSGRRTFLQGADAALGRAVLVELAESSGGQSFVPEINNELELIGVCTQITMELRRNYTISFYPTESGRDQKWHRIRVEVNKNQRGERVYLSYRKGYRLAK
jgi:Ca-activated chloride channel family protein